MGLQRADGGQFLVAHVAFEGARLLVLNKHLRAGSGGRGALAGGEGVVREVEFRGPLQVSILSERRAFAPWGAQGGGEGARGRNTLLRRHPVAGGLAPVVNLGGKASFAAGAGDRLRVETPGGGGFGAPGAAEGAAGGCGGGGGGDASALGRHAYREADAGPPPRASGSLAALEATQQDY